MKRNTVHKIIVPILALLTVSQAVTVLFRAKISHDAFEVFHEGGGTILIGLIIVHLLLNINWVKSSYLGSGKLRAH